MRKISINKIQKGMKLGKAIYASNGQVLLVGGAELNPAYSKRLQGLGFSKVLVKDSYCQDLLFPEIVSERTRIDGAVTLKTIFEQAPKCKKIDTTVLKAVVNQLVDEVVQSRKHLFEASDVRSYDGYLFDHSMSVSIIALRIGLQLNYNELQLRDLGIGALLHDIGMMFVDKQILEKTGSLTATELEKVKQHSSYGFNLLRQHKDINLLSAHVAFQHHERFDGAGYPRLLKSNEICEYARIVAIADMFDALTSENKYHNSYSVPSALEIMREHTGRQLDHDLIKIFLENVALYSTGQLVELNTGEVAVVVANRFGWPQKPRVRIILNNGKKLAGSFPEIDLHDSPDLSIVRALDDEDMYTNICTMFKSRITEN